ncbi:hypothetical protein RHGRI_006217 [Rhododendron griersonianum]|uniref:Uncharacterized protein n=1 Tax=Rhododendron griersonianum TaxID=479676 RepID=A0AAV6KTM4_9ERIC|nr:hypothetical protein RHGRI_006217 [Rhododendron griersonianum]
MGTREVYEQKLRSGNLYHDPTMNPGLGSPRCPRCLSLLNPNAENGEWAITSVLHDATSVSLGRRIATWYLCDDSWLESNKNRKVYDDKSGAFHGMLDFSNFSATVLLIYLVGLFGPENCNHQVPNMFVQWRSAPEERKAGSGIGGLLSAIHGFNTGIPYVQKHVKGPKWLPFLVGLPPLLMFSAASAAFGGYALPTFTQLTVTSYYAASSASQYGISLLIRRIEESHTSLNQQERLR